MMTTTIPLCALRQSLSVVIRITRNMSGVTVSDGVTLAKGMDMMVGDGRWAYAIRYRTSSECNDVVLSFSEFLRVTLLLYYTRICICDKAYMGASNGTATIVVWSHFPILEKHWRKLIPCVALRFTEMFTTVKYALKSLFVSSWEMYSIILWMRKRAGMFVCVCVRV